MKLKDNIKQELIEKFRKMKEAGKLEPGNHFPPNWLPLEYYLKLKLEQEKVEFDHAVKELVSEGIAEKSPHPIPTNIALDPDFDLTITEKGLSIL